MLYINIDYKMDSNIKFLINTGEIYIHEYTNWQANDDLREYVDEMETLILHILRRNKLVAVSSDTHDQEYFITKRDQSEIAQIKALEDKKSPFTFFSVHKRDDTETPILSSVDFTMEEVAELILNGESKDYKWELYDYSHPYTIIKDPVDPYVFEFFFAFKLRQIDLMETDQFLFNHLGYSYENDRRTYLHFLTLILRKYDALFDADKVTTVKEWIESNSSPEKLDSIMIDDFEKIEWLGTQKQLAELLIELKKKGWISEIDHYTIKKTFTNSDTIQQLFKGYYDATADEYVYDQIYTKRYRAKFRDIKKC